MKKIKFLELLKSLTSRELKSFSKYLALYYEEHEAALKLFQHIRQFHPKMDDAALSIDYMAVHILHDKTKRVSNEASKLLGWLEEFLVLEKLRGDKDCYEKQKILIDIYKERHLYDFYLKKIDTTQQKVLENSNSIWRFYQLLALSHAQYYIPPMKTFDLKARTIQEPISHAQAFHALLHLKYQCEVAAIHTILRRQQEEHDTEAAMPAATQDAHYTALYHLYDTAHKMLHFKENEYYADLKNRFFEQQTTLDTEDRYVLLNALINYMACRIRTDHADELKEVFSLYKYGIEEEILQSYGYLTENHFQNIINIACELKEYDWLDIFMERYKNTLIKHFGKGTVNLAQSRVLFGKKLYAEALQLLRVNPAKGEAAKFHTRLIEIQCFFELRETHQSSLEAAMDTFQLQLSRNKKLNATITEGGLNFVAVLKNIIKNKTTSADLLQVLKNHQPIFGKYWLEEKIKELHS